MMTGHEKIKNKIEPSSHPAFVKKELNSQTPSLKNVDQHSLLLPGKFIIHHPKAGINPLVDASAYLFSVIGKLKQLKTCRHLSRLHKDLITEINTFQDAAKAQGYSSEYVLVSRYALCATLDDVIVNTVWGGQGQWDNYSLLAVFNQDAFNQDRFFIILDRIIKDPTLYIDLMEFMYFCLSLGFKGSYRSSEFTTHQLEQITHLLYKHIRAHHGDLNKTLSPFPVRGAHVQKKESSHTPLLFVFLGTLTIVLALFIGLGLMLDTISNQAYQELMHIGKSILYETHDT